MKKNFSTLLLLIAMSTLLTLCTKSERDVNLKLSPVPSLFAPADNIYIKLNPASGTTVTFQWDQAFAEDGALVLYEVAFDQVGGDFSKPFFTVVSNNRGVDNQLILTHGQLNQIAALGGSDFFQRKKFIWTVFATKGTNSQKAAQSRTLDLERPAGFAVIPGNVYLYGTGTEAGNTLSAALKMHQVSSGVFEIFTKLSAGTYKFVDGITGTPRQFSIVSAAGINGLVNGGETTVTNPGKIMRITISFNDVNAMFAEVKSIQLWYCQASQFKATLNYTSNGEFRSSGYVADWIPVGWSPEGEQRYKFKMVYNDGTGDKDLWINSFYGDPANQDTYPSTPEYRKVNLDKNDGSQYDWGWKMVMSAVPIGSTVDFWVTLRGSDAFYTQNYQKQ